MASAPTDPLFFCRMRMCRREIWFAFGSCQEDLCLPVLISYGSNELEAARGLMR